MADRHSEDAMTVMKQASGGDEFYSQGLTLHWMRGRAGSVSIYDNAQLQQGQAK